MSVTEILHGTPYKSMGAAQVAPPAGIADLSRFEDHGTFGAGAAAPAWRILPSNRWVLYHDGGDYTDFGAIATGSPLILGISPMTVIVYINSDSVANNRHVISNWAVGGGDLIGEIAIRQVAGGGILFRRKTAAGTGTSITTAVAPLAGRWYQVACVWDGTTYYIYTNGQLNNSGAGAIGGFAGGATNLYLGCFTGPAEYWLGYIDPEVIILKRAMSAGEVATDYQEKRGYFGV